MRLAFLRGYCRPMLLYRKSTSKTYPHPLRKNGERLPIVACIIVAEIRLLLLGNFETKARNLGMRPKVCCRPLLLFRKSTSKTYPYSPTEKRRKTSYSSMHNSSRNSATIIRKFRDLGSKFSNETQRVCLRPLLL